MKHPARIVFWKSTVDASRCGVEIADLGLCNGRLEAELDRVLGGLHETRPSFVIVSGLSSPRDLRKAISRLSDFVASAHVCFALDHASILTLDSELLRDTKFSVLLDRVNAETPLGAMSDECVEAVRFDATFADKAASNLRLSCVLDSMLRLARELGVATLGWPFDPEHSPTGEFEFDYVAAPELSELHPA